jgi:hypothetical protein
MGVYGAAVLALPVTQFSLRVATIIYATLGLMLFVVRIIKTRHYSYDPEK